MNHPLVQSQRLLLREPEQVLRVAVLVQQQLLVLFLGEGFRGLLPF